jgi:hypothetical protein
MCSGCAGDYSGDFDDDDGAAEPGSPPEPAGYFREADAGQNVEYRANDFEADWTAEPNCKCCRRGETERGLENCEILVSAARIVEIRIFDAKPGHIFSLNGEQILEARARGDHSSALSAKYYQTLGMASGSRPKGSQLADWHRVSDVMGRQPWLRCWARLFRRFMRANHK